MKSYNRVPFSNSKTVAPEQRIIKNEVSLKLMDSGVQDYNLRSGAFHFIPYAQMAGFSG